MSALQGESGQGVIVAARIYRHPGRRRVAANTVMAQPIRHVIRICDSRVRHLVAGITIVHRIRVSAAMTTLAVQIEVSAVYRKASLIMIELCRLPRRCRMTRLTIMTEAGRFVIGIGGGGKSGSMAGEAVTCCIGIATAMTVLASQCCVRAR